MADYGEDDWYGSDDDEYEEGDDADEDDLTGSDVYQTDEEEEAAPAEVVADDKEATQDDVTAADREAAKPWEAPDKLPAATWSAVEAILGGLTERGRAELTVLVVGKPGCGVSSTANALLGTPRFDARPGHLARPTSGADRVTVELRTRGPYLLRVVHVAGLLSVGAQAKVNYDVLEELGEELKGRRVDAALWVDRLDTFRVEQLDRDLWDALAQTLGGGGLMARVILCLTHGEVPVPQGYDYAALVDKRAGALRRALRRRVGGGGAPCVVVEHLTRCERNKEGQAVLPNGDPWKVTLFRAIVDMALAHDAGAAVEYAAPNPSARRLWLIPVCLVAQLLLRHLVMERVIEWDATRGDRTGQYDKDTVADRRRAMLEKKEMQKEMSKREAANAAAGIKGATAAQQALSRQAARGARALQYEEDDSDDSDDDDEDYT